MLIIREKKLGHEKYPNIIRVKFSTLKIDDKNANTLVYEFQIDVDDLNDEILSLRESISIYFANRNLIYLDFCIRFVFQAKFLWTWGWISNLMEYAGLRALVE